MKPRQRISIETEMNRFVRDFGGALVLEALGTGCPPFANADYWFESENIIAELKCLTEDKTNDSRMRRALNRQFDDFVDSGRMPDPGPGLYRINSSACPREFQREIYKIFARPIKRRFRKANEQIKATRQKLGRADAQGLVLLANDGNYRLEVNQLMCAVDLALGKDFSGIDSVVVFTENMPANTPFTERHANVWIPADREGHRPISAEFLHRFSDGWFKHVSRLVGKDIPVFRDIEHAVLDSLYCDQVASKAMGKR